MSRLKDFNINAICLIVFLSGIQASCSTAIEAMTVATSQPSPHQPTTTPTHLSIATVTESPHLPVSASLSITVPNGDPPTLDGKISPGEWGNARQEFFSDGSELLMLHHDGYLYLAIKANNPELIVGNIFVDHAGQVRILHSSAALGTAVYEKGADGWNQTQAFSWQCRATDDGSSAQAEREAFLKKENWLASNSRMGLPQELEYGIATKDSALRLAVTFTRISDTRTRPFWPGYLSDDSVKSPLGEYPLTMQFSPTTWMNVIADEGNSNTNENSKRKVRTPDQMTMVFVPGSTFQMGSTKTEVIDAINLCKQHYPICNEWFYMREYPQHPVTLNDFWLDQTEVSNIQYRQCVEAGICIEPTSCQKGEPTYDDPEKANHPVVCVSWDDAQTYCDWVSARLPTEAEWEYAFRGEQNLNYPWGNSFDGSKLNYCDANCEQPHADNRYNDHYAMAMPVGFSSGDISWSGALNMSGNISEWVADWSSSYSSEPELNPVGPESGTEKILRGCNWSFQPAYCRGAARPSVSPDTQYNYLGFRCASSVLQ